MAKFLVYDDGQNWKGERFWNKTKKLYKIYTMDIHVDAKWQKVNISGWESKNEGI